MVTVAVVLIVISAGSLILIPFWRRARPYLWMIAFFGLLNSYFAAPLNWQSFIGGTGFFLAPIRAVDPPIPLEKLALPTDSPEAMIEKMGCFICHKIPGIPRSRQSDFGPLLIPATMAKEVIRSPEYLAQVKSGRAKATTPREYLIESILDPDAFILPGFVDRNHPEKSLMYPLYAERFTPQGLDRLVDHRRALDVYAAMEDGLVLGHQSVR